VLVVGLIPIIPVNNNKLEDTTDDSLRLFIVTRLGPKGAMVRSRESNSWNSTAWMKIVCENALLCDLEEDEAI